MDIIAYHANCPDGWVAALVAKKKYPSAKLVPLDYGASCSLDLFTDKKVLVVDFSWLRMQTLIVRDVVKSLQILDHHKSAQKELEGLDYATFDMNRSGATLSWDFCFPTEPRPWYVDYTEDRDLGRNVLPDSREINAVLMAIPRTMESWDCISERLSQHVRDDVVLAGGGIVAHIDRYIEHCLEQRQIGVLKGKTVAVVNAQYMNSSEVGIQLCEFAEVGIVWSIRGDGLMRFGLRSTKDDVDVSEIAKQYGGGGHFHASGFELSLSEGRKLLDRMIPGDIAYE